MVKQVQLDSILEKLLNAKIASVEQVKETLDETKAECMYLIFVSGPLVNVSLHQSKRSKELGRDQDPAYVLNIYSQSC